MILNRELSDIIVLDAEHGDFDFRRIAQHLKNSKLVILFVRTDERSAPASGFAWFDHSERRRYYDYFYLRDSIQFLTARTLVRNALAHYLDVTPFSIKLTSDQHIKPVAACDNPYLPIPHFSISHSGDWIAIAIHADRPVGLDIECSEALELHLLCKSQELFNQKERDLLDACPDNDIKIDLFYRFWRCKEAIMKATGRGFSLTPCKIDLISDNGSIKKTIFTEGKAWQLYQIDTWTDLKLAVAIQQSSVSH